MELEIKSFSEFNEKKMSTEDMQEALYELIGTKADLDMWEWFEQNMPEAGYAGDMTPDDYVEAMSDSEIKACYRAMKKYL